MTDITLGAAILAAVTMAIKASGPLLLAAREIPRSLRRLIVALPVALLAALVVSQLVGGADGVGLGERLIGVGLGAALLIRGLPLAVAALSAAAATGLLRLIG